MGERGQVSTVDEAEPHNPVRWLAVSRAVARCRGRELGPLWWPVLAAGVGVFNASF